uniref:Uncharacterized protein n=1 Tax=Arundo donax TaxID=35708 RepID=A0A0A8YLI3_ARUDO
MIQSHTFIVAVRRWQHESCESNHNVGHKYDMSNKLIFSVNNNHCRRSHKRKNKKTIHMLITRT